MAKRTVKAILRRTPYKSKAVLIGARLPPALKGAASEKLFGFLRELCLDQLPSHVVSNLGISRNLQVRISKNASATYLFGGPESYIGERGGLYLCRYLANRCAAFLDIGAHRGYFVFFLRASSNIDVPIYWFEPDPVLAKELDANCKRNDLKGVFGFELAAGSVSGRTEFFQNLTDDSSSSLVEMFSEKHELKKLTVESTRLDKFVRARNLKEILVKVDVEGAEFEFLDGAASIADRISYLLIEILGPAIKSKFVTTVMKQLGMNAYYINDFRLEHSADGAYSYVAPQYNWLFCQHSPKELKGILTGSKFSVIE